MVSKRLKIALAVTVALAAIAIPVGLSILVARQQATERERMRVLTYARDVLHRTEAMLGQIETGVERLEQAGESDPCSLRSLDVMRRVDLGSGFIQAIGRVDGNRMACASIGDAIGAGFDLGAADSVSPRGVKTRYRVRFPFAPDQEFLVIQLRDYAAIIHKGLTLDSTTADPQVSLANFSSSARRIAASRGVVRTEWIDALQGRHEVSFRDGDHLVAVVLSRSYYAGAIAAIPKQAIAAQTRSFARILVPIGVLAGLLALLAIGYIARLQQAMPAIMRAALRNHEFFMQYQPIVDLESGAWVGAEALVRWRRPDGEMVRPDIFIQVAEDSGVIRKITERVLELIERDIVDLFGRYPDFYISINLSSADLHFAGTVDALRGLAEATGARHGNLVVEATERGFLRGDLAREVIQGLRDTGIQIAIDDFGTGYSSLSLLNTLPIDKLKIDKAFVDTIGAGAATSQVVAHIIEMARDLDLEMVAEGVQDEAQASYLREHGVRFAQGWLFGRPMGILELMAALRERAEP